MALNDYSINVSEKHIEKRVKDYAKSKGLLTYKFSSPSKRGVPDQIFIYKGYVFFIEFKTLKGKVSKLQEREHRILKTNGCDIYVVCTYFVGKSLIDEIINRKNEVNND